MSRLEMPKPWLVGELGRALEPYLLELAQAFERGGAECTKKVAIVAAAICSDLEVRAGESSVAIVKPDLDDASASGYAGAVDFTHAEHTVIACAVAKARDTILELLGPVNIEWHESILAKLKLHYAKLR